MQLFLGLSLLFCGLIGAKASTVDWSIEAFGTTIVLNVSAPSTPEPPTGDLEEPGPGCLSSSVCQQYTTIIQDAINEQIQMELSASYAYLTMYNYFSRDDPGLRGFAKFFFEASEEERKHAKLLIDYQNLRGGQVSLKPIQPILTTIWAPLASMQDALKWEKSVNRNLLAVHEKAGQQTDPMTMDFLETHLLSEQLTSIKELSSYVKRISSMVAGNNEGIASHLIDQELLKK